MTITLQAPQRAQSIGDLLRQWRKLRLLSQLEQRLLIWHADHDFRHPFLQPQTPCLLFGSKIRPHGGMCHLRRQFPFGQVQLLIDHDNLFHSSLVPGDAWWAHCLVCRIAKRWMNDKSRWAGRRARRWAMVL